MIVNGIEWDLDINYITGLQTKKFIENFISIDETLPLKNSSIRFQDDKWDFRPFSLNKASNAQIFNFDSYPEVFKNMAKYLVLFQLINGGLKVTSLVRRMQEISQLCVFIWENGFTSFQFVTISTIESFLHTKNTISKKVNACVALKLLFRFIDDNYNYKLSFDYNTSLDTSRLQKIIAANLEENKTPNIPDEYFDKMLSILLNCLNDTSIEYTYRAVAGLYIILCQTGLRLGECIQITTNALKPITIRNSTIETYYLEYKTFKSGSKYQEYLLGRTYVNEITKHTFDTLLRIRPEGSSNLLFNPKGIRVDYPSTDYVKSIFYKIMFTFGKDLVFDTNRYPQIKNINFYDNNRKCHILSIPQSKQFRVHLCTELYNRNISLLYIRKYMNHLSSEMEGYYVRPKTQKQEDVEFSNRLIKEIVSKEASILGNDGSKIQDNIEKYIKNIKVESSLEEVFKVLNNKLVIRAKRGGVCIKTSIRDCAKDAQTDEIFCAYNLCPNLFHFYFMIDVSYEDFIMTQKTYQENKNNGFKTQMNKELMKIKQICRLRLQPELEELKRKLIQKPQHEILQQYPNLENILLNLNNIDKEIQLWMKMN